MTITEDHWLDTAVREVIPGGNVMPIRRFLVIHFTSGASAKSSINFWRTPDANGASAHLVIDRDGTVYQCRPFNRTCGHAGKSEWRDPKSKARYTGLNACSIGIELANAGDNDALFKKWAVAGTVRAKHKNGGALQDWEVYPDAQLKACEEMSKLLVSRYHLDDVVGHEDIAPDRKNDPGPAFPMGKLREACGFPAKI